MSTVYLALGSNVGEKNKYIESAITLLQENISGIKRANIYESKAVGYTNQANFLNTALKGSTDLSPEKLLDFIKEVEITVGRIRRFKLGPREIDIDIIFYADKKYESKELIIPHPSYQDRDFVLRPLLDINDDLKDPISGQSLSEILESIPENDRSIIDSIN